MGSDEQQSHAARVTELESALAHHQRLCEQLNQVVTEQAGIIDDLQRRVALLENTVKEVQYQLPEDREIAEEKPPHY